MNIKNNPEWITASTQEPESTRKPHILFLFSDTGGGHRAAAESIIEALQLEFGDALTTEMVDFLLDYAPPPYNRLPEFYPDFVRIPELWGVGFLISDGRRQARIMTSTMWPIVRRAARRLVREHPNDLLVCVHALGTSFLLRALGSKRPPFITVVTDMVSTHALWFDQRADLTLVPTEMARQRALEFNMSPDKVIVVGQPVSERCSTPAGDRQTLRQKFGWTLDKATILLVGGGEGMGPLEETAIAIDESGLDVNLVIVAGRNIKLKADLEVRTWDNPTYIYGFTKDMPDFMRASDVLVTKAGPGTIAEALIASLPIILYSKLPGQEDGNVRFVESVGAGVWAPEPLQVVRTLTRWICRPNERLNVVENCRQAARPDASRRIARILGEQLGLPTKG
ncbi:MAG TPA: galactosyldiacylglycerol synthase [Anaerolineae bacterium]|nr:galactosyldiacylglycerol synthase [Anaerolineae bacterium]HCM96426.1 galactosyldiacylglycerol synthase [Anaerolineae bacterium]